MERQLGPIGSIRRDHINRYRFATERVKGRVLDAACGVGYGSKMMQDAGHEVVGVDVEPEAISYAIEHYAGPKYVLGDVIQAPWTGTFHYAVSFETIEHLDNDVGFLNQLRKSASFLICSVPNQNYYPFVAKNFKDDKYPHIRHYTPVEFEHVLNVADWVVTEKWCQKSKVGEVEPGTEGMFLVFVCR